MASARRRTSDLDTLTDRPRLAVIRVGHPASPTGRRTRLVLLTEAITSHGTLRAYRARDLHSGHQCRIEPRQIIRVAAGGAA